ncbi:hypothetical protein [Subtercola lobariae]|uniref:Uncharacterized protein n=1 Tax=Subtercola lobariae TaxID=1588641 RepID=A0A917BCZ8_9MICO|nr:hypothetical protein [Subtercola lobariae]GGF37952.1 hypothetical protein GCM10011399_33680 [Subtercola lobariae]
MPPANVAAHIYESIVENLELLQRLHAEGKIVMTPDSFNEEWRDETVAVEVATKALEWARDAVKWMITQ